MVDRLKKRSEFLTAQRSGHKVVAKTIIVELARNRTDDIRVGFTVSKRVSKLAVIRNRIKRRLRAAADEAIPEIGIEGFDYVIVGRLSALNNDFETILKDLRYAVNRLHKEESEKSQNANN